MLTHLKQSPWGHFSKGLPLRSLPRLFMRGFSLHEYQSMELLQKYGLPVPKFVPARTVDEAVKLSRTLGTTDVVVKAQVLAGGRGKGTFDSGFKGGVHAISSLDKVKYMAEQMLGHKLITKQSGPAGKPCNVVLICERLFPRQEYYLAIMLDRASQGALLVGSQYGGMDIEAVAASDPNSIVKVPITANKSIEQQVDLPGFVKSIGIRDEVSGKAVECIKKLYKFFCEKDVTLVEINPMVESNTGAIVCIDAKISFDDNADFRQQEIFALRDPSQENPREVQASALKLNYIDLDGNIGCLVNGAGLAMATMDIIKLHGGEPANFLDVGGGASSDQVTEAVKILGADPRVSAILINIFGGIMRCDVIADGILHAIGQTKIKTPLIVRLQGTKVKEANEMIRASGLRVFSYDDLDEAAAKSVQLARIVDIAKDAKVGISISRD